MKITDAQIMKAAQQWAQATEYYAPDNNSFAAGAKWMMQKLQKTPCTTPLSPSKDEGPFCRSCKKPMDEDEGRWGWCGDCYES